MRGNISSPIDNDGSNKYPNGAECIWDIVGEPGFHVELNFYGRFDLEDTFGCTNDYLMVSLVVEVSQLPLIQPLSLNLPTFCVL